MAKSGSESDVDALFALPLADFTKERNALAARLKREGHSGEAESVKALAKPSIAAWAVNQLYWKHRDSFDELIAAGRRFRRAQVSQLSGKNSDTRGLLNERREALSGLSHLAASMLREAGHSPTSDILRRVTNTLEALTVSESLPDKVTAGHLATELDPPGFEALAGLVPVAGIIDDADDDRSHTTRPGKTVSDPSRLAAAKELLEASRQTLGRARESAEGAAAALKTATAAATEAKEQQLDARARLEKATAAAQKAAEHARNAEADAENATKAVREAERTVEKATFALQALLPAASDRR